MIPILNREDFQTDPAGFSRNLGKVCRDHEFFLLKNHSVPVGLIQATCAMGDSFFDLPDAEKAKLSIAGNPNNRGWACLGNESLDKSSGQIDQKQAFNVGFDLAANDPRVLRVEPFRGEIGAGAHCDYGLITLFMTDGVSGLRVQPHGQDWTDVPHDEGAFVVNIGDCLMRWTNDTYASTPRRSIAFFLDPNPDSLIAALPGIGVAQYPAVFAADYLRARLDAT